MTSKLTRDIIQSEIADFFAGVVEIHTELGGPNTVEEAQNQLTERVLACVPAVDCEPVAWEVKGILCHTLDEASKYVGVPEPLYADPRLEPESAEPVAYMYDGEDGREYNGHNEFPGGGKGVPLYRHAQTAPEREQLAIKNFRSAMEGIGHIRRTLEETFGGLHGTHVEPDVLAECKAICDAIYAAYGHAQPALVVPNGLRLALSNAGMAAPESDEMLAATFEKHIQALVTWVKDRKPFQSAPVVPSFEEWLSAANRKPLGWVKDAMREAYDACRAAMLQELQKSAGASNNCRSNENVQDLQAGNSPAQGGSRCSIKAAPALDSSPKTADARCGNSPVILNGSASMLRRWLAFGRGMQNAGSQLPHNLIAETESMLAAAQHDTPALNSLQSVDSVVGRWVPVSERMPEGSEEVLCAKEFDGPGDWRRKVGYLLAGKWTVYGASWTPTHWMPLPAAPQEVNHG